jgi:hypothetical protein
LLSLTFCSQLRYRAVPEEHRASGEIYHSLKIKVNLREVSSGRKQGFKILLKFTETRARMLFLGPPLNKVYAKLVTDGESALLINAKKKKYWQGNFKALLREMWDVNFDYPEFMRLLVDGIIPRKKMKKSDLEISVEADKASGKPGQIQISGRNIIIRLEISNRRTVNGTIVFAVNLELLRETATLQDLLENE